MTEQELEEVLRSDPMYVAGYTDSLVKSLRTQQSQLRTQQSQLQKQLDEWKRRMDDIKCSPGKEVGAKPVQYLVIIDGCEYGPLSMDELERMAKLGKIQHDTEIKKVGSSKWFPASKYGLLEVMPSKIVESAKPGKDVDDVPSFSIALVATMVLYCVLYVPGIIANIVWYNEAKEVKSRTGIEPYGLRGLEMMLRIQGIIVGTVLVCVIACFGFLFVSSLAGIDLFK